MDDVLDSTPDITPELVESYLTAIEYPVTLDDIISFAIRQRAPQNIIATLQALTPGVYHSLSELDFYLKKSLY